MTIQKQSKSLIFILLAIASFYFLWVAGLKEIIYNYWTRSIRITELHQTKELHLKKYDAQTSVYGMELEITGSTDREIVLLFGPEKGKYQQEVLIKTGIVSYDFSSDWYDDDCYIYLSSDSNIKTDLKIDYRFYGNAE